jgi:DNA adenine methylase
MKCDLDAVLPSDVTCVASPFFGGGAYEFHLARKGYNVVGADLNGALVNFWNATRNNANEVASMVEKVSGGGCLDRHEFERLRLKLMEDSCIASDPLHAAAVFFVLNRSSYNGVMRYFSNAGRFTPSSIARLRNFEWPSSMCELQTRDVFDFLEEHRDMFWFLDPPYFNVKGGLYGLDAKSHVFNHVEFASFLKRASPATRWMLTYDDTPEIRKLYEFANVMSLNVHYCSRHTNKKELIITNYNT